MVDRSDPGSTGRPLQKDLGRIVVPYLGAAVEANDQRGRCDLAERKAQMRAVDGPERAGTADVGRYLAASFRDLFADDKAIFGDSAVLAGAQALKRARKPLGQVEFSHVCIPFSS
jgi:hypothetical protein